MKTMVAIAGALCASVLAVQAVAQEAGTADQGDTWAFDMDADPFAESPIDLRGLNEKVAGGTGFVRLAKDGNGFVRGDGEPLRFWGVHPAVKHGTSEEDARTHFRWLARLGVNLVRQGATVQPNKPDAKLTDVNEQGLHSHWKTVAFAKEQGIYTMVSPFWAHGGFGGPIPEAWGIEGYSGKDALYGLMYFYEPLQDAYKVWIKRLLTEPNPYTGVPLRDEPAVAIIEIFNEDCFLFYTVDRVKGGPRRILEGRFHDWAVERYGSAANALDQWGNTAVEGDAPDEGRLGLMSIWFNTRDGLTKAPNEQRRRDQLRFYAGVQRGFFAMMKEYINEELGCRQLVNSTNFRPADPTVMGDLDNWCKSACDTIAINHYYDSGHTGENAGWRLDPGHYFTGVSATTQPWELPAVGKQVVGRPSIITETLWVVPNPYEPEGPLMMASYMSMNGMDGVMWAGARSVTWTPNPYRTWERMEGGFPMHKWDCAQPATMGQFPAAALIYRRGYVAPAPTVVHEERTLDSMIACEMPAIAAASGFDPNRDEETPDGDAGARTAAPPFAFLVGRVEAKLGVDEPAVEARDVSDYIDREGGTVRCANGQLAVDYKDGIFRLDAPKAQGVAGFIGNAGGQVALADVAVQSSDEFIVVTAVSLDDRPLAESERVLVQVGRPARPTDWKVEPAQFEARGQQRQGFRVVNTGRMPWRIDRAHGVLTLTNRRVSRATILDENGERGAELPVRSRKIGTLWIPLPEEALYFIVE